MTSLPLIIDWNGKRFLSCSWISSTSFLATSAVSFKNWIFIGLCPQAHPRYIWQFFGPPSFLNVLGFSSFRSFARFIEVDAADSNTDWAAGMTMLSNQSLYRSRNFFSTRETSCHFMSIFFKLVRTTVLFSSFNSKFPIFPIFDSFHFLQMYIFHWFHHGNDLLMSKKGPSFSYYISPIYLKIKSN